MDAEGSSEVVVVAEDGMNEALPDVAAEEEETALGDRQADRERVSVCEHEKGGQVHATGPYPCSSSTG